MRHLKRVTALLVSMTVLAAVLLGIGVASAFTTAVDNDSGSSFAVSFNSASEGDTVSAVIDMYWNAVDEDGEALHDSNDKRIWTQNASEYRNACASSTTARIIRNGVDVAELSFDGVADATENNGTIGGDDFTWKETSPWHVEVAGLPKKASDGSIYSYLMVQNQIDGFVSGETKRETNTDGSLIACFYNYRSSGSAPTIVPISACWKDGGDVESRKPIKVGLYSARDIHRPDGSGVAYNKDNQIEWVELNIGNSWYAEIVVPISGLSLSNNDLYIRELSTYEDDGSPDGKCKIVSRSEVASENIGSHTYDSLLRYWPESDANSRMISANPKDGSAYKVSYGVNDTIGSFQVTNQRVGSVEVSIDQNWLDVGADKSMRPECAVSVTCPNNDIVFVYTNDRSLSAGVSGYGDVALYTEDETGRDRLLTGVDESLSEDTDVAVSNSMKTLTFKRAGSSKDNSHFSIANLPKYDSQGVEINWEIKETWTGDHGEYRINDTASDDVSALPSCSPVSWHHGDKLTFSFANKRVGTKDVTFHAKWFDHFVKDGNGQRPELSLKLYRQMCEYGTDGKPTGSITLEEVPASEYGSDYSWSPSDTADRVPNDTDAGDFTKFLTFSKLPKYDDHGKMCVYYVCPSLSLSQGEKDGQSYSYEQSVSKDSYSKDPGSWGSADPELIGAAESAAISDSLVAYREDSTFNFHITGSMSLTGSVQWNNIPEGQSSELPDISVYAQRRLASGLYDSSGSWKDGAEDITSWSNLNLALGSSNSKGYTVTSSETGLDNSANMIADGQTAVAWTDNFTKSENDIAWSYSITTYGDNAQTGNSNTANKLDAFDSEGRLFEYRVREVIDGMVGSAAFDGSKFVGSSSAAGPEEAFAKLYDIAYVNSSNLITNTYKGTPKASLELHELFVVKVEDGSFNPPASFKYPESKFKLYRYDKNSSSSNKLASAGSDQTLAASAFGSGALTFDDLEVYTLAGAKWKYVAIEDVPNGYAATSGVGNLTASAADFQDSHAWAASNAVTLPVDATSSWSMGPATELVEGNAPAVMTFKNTFTPGTVTLAGKIEWSDCDGIFGTRPDGTELLSSLQFTRLYVDKKTVDNRVSDFGYVTLQSSNQAGSDYFTWSIAPSSDGDTWEYEISNVEKWAPDGHLWAYKISVSPLPMPDQYILSKNDVGGVCDSGSSSFPSIGLRLKGQAGLKVTWSNDPYDTWSQRPSQYFTLQARVADPNEEWIEAGSFFTNHGVKKSDLTIDNDYDGTGLSACQLGNRYTTDKLTSDGHNLVSYDADSMWSSLPIKLKQSNGTVVSVEYRVVESLLVYEKYGSKVKVYLDCDNDGTYSVRDGVYSQYFPLQEEVGSNPSWKSEITNTYQGEAISIDATLSWDDDDNALNTRPDKLTFALQRSPDGGSTWAWFTKYGAAVPDPFNGPALNSDLLTKTVKATEPSFSIGGLPKYGAGSDGKQIEYKYRAVQLIEGSYMVADSQVLATSSDGTKRLEVVSVDAAGKQKFANKLVSADVSGTVTWNDYGSGLTSTLDPATCDIKFKVFRNVSGGDEEQITIASAEGQSSPAPKWTTNNDGTWTYSFENLPKVDKNGVQYLYRVEEASNKVPGWYSKGCDDNGDIAYTSMRLSFDVIASGPGSGAMAATKLNGATLELSDASGSKAATWSRANDGAVTVAVEDGFGKAGAGQSDGWIVGLPAGEYTVHEIMAASGYQAIADFKVEISADGSVALKDSPADAALAIDGFTVNVVNSRVYLPDHSSSGGGNDSDDKKDPEFTSAPVFEWTNSVAEDGTMTLTVTATFISKDGKEQVVLSSKDGQIDIELSDVESSIYMATVKDEYVPKGYAGTLTESKVVKPHDGHTIVFEKIEKATTSKDGFEQYRCVEDDTIQKVVIPKDDIKVSPETKKYKASSLKKKQKKFTIKVKNAKGKVSYKSSSKKVKVSKKGKVTVKKGAKKGTYKVTVTSAATKYYAKAVKVVRVKVK